jgi:hypothetical protein
MATFVHLASEQDLASIRRGGLKAKKFGAEAGPSRGVFAMPVTPDFQYSHQWLREMHRWRSGPMYGVYFRLRDDEIVYLGAYNGHHEPIAAAAAVAALTKAPQPGFEVIVPRAVAVREVLRIKALPQIVGWRFWPQAKGQAPIYPQPGTPGSARVRKGLEKREADELRRYRARYGV